MNIFQKIGCALTSDRVASKVFTDKTLEQIKFTKFRNAIFNVCILAPAALIGGAMVAGASVLGAGIGLGVGIVAGAVSMVTRGQYLTLNEEHKGQPLHLLSDNIWTGTAIGGFTPILFAKTAVDAILSEKDGLKKDTSPH